MVNLPLSGQSVLPMERQTASKYAMIEFNVVLYEFFKMKYVALEMDYYRTTPWHCGTEDGRCETTLWIYGT